MSSTIRAIVNNKRVATGKPWKNQFLQVYPELKTFASEAEWRSQVYQSILSSIKFEPEVVEEKKMAVKKEEAKKPPVPVVPPVAPAQPKQESDDWICGYCSKGPGNDHRMCICKGYYYSVQAWEKDRIFATKQESTADLPLSLNPKDWSHKEVRQTTLPAGTYYIGDLCYALDDKLYEQVFGAGYDSGLYSMTKNPNHCFWLESTDGDGEFTGSDSRSYFVDAAILGIASESTLDPKKKPYTGGHMHTFKSPVKVGLKNDRFFFLGQDYTDPQLEIPLYQDEEEYNESE